MQTIKATLCAATVAVLSAAASAAAPATPPRTIPNQSQPQAAPTPTPLTVTNAPRVTIPVYQGRDPDLIADTDDIITQIIPLEYISAPEMLRTLSSVVKTNTPMVAAANAIVVTDSSNLIKRMVQIVALLDVKPANANVIAIIPLQSGNASEAAREINAVFNSQNP